jgi:pimeloyl-ACP methyl ester carboxylesterase
MTFRGRLIGMLALVALQLSAKPIRIAEAVPIGGIQQWITIRGVSDTLPVLLFLHGGPGNSVMGYADRFTKDLQQHFVLVHWDQRESGKTASLNKSPLPLTVALMEQDASEMVDYLRKRFNKERIYLVGHSWGGLLALRVAAAHPEWLAACVAAAPMINQWESERQTLEWLMEMARTTGNQEAMGELSQVHIPFESSDELYFHRRWLLFSNHQNPVSRNYVRKWGQTWFPMYQEACSINLFKEMPAVSCPVYFFVGSTDRQASSTITEAYFHSLHAEKKDLIWFTNSGHSLNLTEPKKFQDTLVGLLSR